MATPVFCCGGECGINSTSSLNQHFIRTGTGSISTTTFRTGLHSYRANPTAGTTFWSTPTSFLGSVTVWITRAYIRFNTLPDADCDVLATSGTKALGLWFKSSDSTLRCGSLSGMGASGVTVTTGQWYRIDLKVDISGSTDLADAQVDGTTLGQHSDAVGNIVSIGEFYFGAGQTCTADLFVDDIVVSTTSADYPIGAGFVKSYIPNADGTHNVAGANDFERSATGTDITNATTTAFQLIDDRPIKSGTLTEYINGVAPPNATDYVEWQYEDSTEADAPRAVEAILTLSDAATAGANDATITLREHAGATSANIFTGAIGASGAGESVFKRAHFATVPGTSDAWTTTKFNALRSRFLVTDAAPDPWVGSAMLEVEFPEPAAPPLADDMAPLQVLVIDDAP